MAQTIHFQIITPERVVFSEEIDQVSIMTTTGEITVFPQHIPLVSVLQTGELRYKKGGIEYPLAVSGGFVEVRPDNTVVILADTAEHAAEINLERAQTARDKALQIMQDAVKHNDVDYVALQAALERATTRLKIGNKYRNIHLPN